jgi:peptidoglycan hydrolase-like protein with peptidoglycan-binding domain
VPAATKSTQTAMLEQASPEIMRIQAGLRAFGNQGVELDGKMGQRTREALKEFQSLFGLPVTGNPDAAVMAKMREIGLTN